MGKCNVPFKVLFLPQYMIYAPGVGHADIEMNMDAYKGQDKSEWLGG
jgi:hypothetical protein